MFFVKHSLLNYYYIVSFIYKFGIHCYGFVIFIASFFNGKAKKRYEGGNSTFNLLQQSIDKSQKYVWIHAASLGEFEQGRPVIEEIKNRFPEKKIVLSFFSPSGYEVRKDYGQVDVVCYLPLDTPRSVKRFLDIVNPEMSIFIKYEFWANYLTELHNRHIPTYIVSAIFRPNQRFFKWYGQFFLRLLTYYKAIYVQDKDSQILLQNHGITSVTVAGDTRFDRVISIAQQAKELPIAKSFSEGASVLVAGSTWPRDEEYLVRFINANKEHKLILVPHEVTPEHIMSICAKMRCSYVLYTQTTPEEASKANCLIVDTIGVLSSLYQYGQVAYVGGGFGVGIHNILEPAVWGMPVVFGTNYHKFREAKELIIAGGAYSIFSYRQFEDLVNRLFHESEPGEVAKQFVIKHQGATQTIVEDIFG